MLIYDKCAWLISDHAVNALYLNVSAVSNHL